MRARRPATKPGGRVCEVHTHFRSYYTFDCGNGTGGSISIFETEKAAVTSNEQAVDWVRKNLTEFLPEPPEILVGETGVTVSV
jgi:hypothetical protein